MRTETPVRSAIASSKIYYPPFYSPHTKTKALKILIFKALCFKIVVRTGIEPVLPG